MSTIHSWNGYSPCSSSSWNRCHLCFISCCKIHLVSSFDFMGTICHLYHNCRLWRRYTISSPSLSRYGGAWLASFLTVKYISIIARVKQGDTRTLKNGGAMMLDMQYIYRRWETYTGFAVFILPLSLMCRSRFLSGQYGLSWYRLTVKAPSWSWPRRDYSVITLRLHIVQLEHKDRIIPFCFMNQMALVGKFSLANGTFKPILNYCLQSVLSSSQFDLAWHLEGQGWKLIVHKYSGVHFRLPLPHLANRSTS